MKPTQRPSLTQEMLIPVSDEAKTPSVSAISSTPCTAAPSLPPCLWRVMRLIWQHGPLTLAEVHCLSPALQTTTVAELLKRLVTRGYLATAPDERSSPPTRGRPKRRYYPRVNYQMGLESVVQRFLADYLFDDSTGLSLLGQAVQHELSSIDGPPKSERST